MPGDLVVVSGDGSSDTTAVKQASTRWKPGQSGNPLGRPVGARNKLSVLSERMLEDEASEIVAKCIDRAKAGDPVAMKLCMERLVAIKRTRRIHLPDWPSEIRTSDDIGSARRVMSAAIQAGELDTEQADALSRFLMAAAKSIDDDNEKRMAAIEQVLKQMQAQPPA